MTQSPSNPAARAYPAPAFRFALVFASGVYLGARTHVPGAAWALAALALILAAVLILRAMPHRAFPLSLTAGALLLCSGALKFAVDFPGKLPLPEPLHAVAAVITGRVIDFPEVKRGRSSFTLLADSCFVRGRGCAADLRVRVIVTAGKTGGESCVIAYGSKVSAAGLLSLPPAERNPGEFSQRAYDQSIGIDAVLSVAGSAGLSVRDTTGGSWLIRTCAAPLRRAILEKTGAALPGIEGEFLKDLLLGERSGIPAETKEAFIDAGVAHVFAVSGYRVLVLTAMIMAALDLLRVPRRLRPLLAAPALLFYMVLAGGHPPVVRGTAMAIIYLIGGSLGRKTGGRNALGLAALLVLGVDSRQLFDPGFQLSFGAVLAIQQFMPPVQALIAVVGRGGPLRAVLAGLAGPAALSVVVSLGTLPVSAAFFGRVSLIGVLTNIVVVPATGLAMMLGTLSLAAGAINAWLGGAYAAACGFLIRWTIRLSVSSAAFPFAAVGTPRFGLWEAVAWYAGLFLVTRWKNRRAAARSLALLLAALNVVMLAPPDPALTRTTGVLRVSMIDVGQGDAVLVEFPGGRALLVDAGGVTLSGDAGKKTVVPFLKRKGIEGLDLLVITHPDADHCGGAASVIGSLRVGRVLESTAPGSSGLYAAYHAAAAAAARGISLDTICAGGMLSGAFPGRLYVLSPPGRGTAVVRGPGGRSTNNNSVVFRLLYGRVAFLFTGDAERPAELVMTRSYGGFLRSAVLKVAHHGSDGATSGEFLDAVRPGIALVSAGLRNRFGHPAAPLLRRLAASGARVMRTDGEGAIILESDGEKVWQIPWRAAYP